MTKRFTKEWLILYSFYWCFPNDVGVSVLNRKATLEKSVEELQKLKGTEEAKLEREKDAREESVSPVTLVISPQNDTPE